MELQRGVCSLCLENGKVCTPSDAEDFSKFLPRILYENFLTEAEPQLAASGKSSKLSPKQNDTPKRKSQSKSPPSSKKRKIFNNCFTYLQPLCNNDYHVDDKHKSDNRLYKKIAYVNLKDVKNIKETPKVRPIIKIKLKPKGKRGEKEKNTSKIENEYLVENSFKTQPYVKLCKSEEIPNKVELQLEKFKSRRHSSYVDEQQIVEEPEENIEKAIEETPKAANVTNLVPKRRVSLYAEPNDGESEEKSDTQTNSDESNQIVASYIKDATFNDNNKRDLLKEIGENNVDNNIEENGIEKSVHKTNEDAEMQQTDDKNNGTNSKEYTQFGDQKNFEKEAFDSSVSFHDSSGKTSPKNDSNNEGSDSDTSDKLKNTGNRERDSLNGSERKKKRVTFSDQIN
ncbi:muscle M-line assembly protein unc-89-like [Asbolus verrucosus]|uniref:Muscle M-line assembly protein unc-89-like n=1 Tax=Asbolus verrucosus TaxID=1661398 RepID=A0A482V7X5_ASBVE|nr:muscle M-line assembly protein unc-89-like [Asbolus verrucosus]